MNASSNSIAILLMVTGGVAATEPGSDVDWRLHDGEGPIAQVLSIPIPENIEQIGGAAQLLFDVDIEFDGEKVTERVRSAWYFGTSDAIRSYATDTISFNGYTDAVTVTAATTLTREREQIPFDPQNAEIIDSSTYHVFTNSKELVISFPGVEVGSITLLEYVREVDRERLEAGWSMILFPQNIFPRTRFALRVRTSAEHNISWGSTSEFVSCESASYSMTCAGRDIPAAQRDHDVKWGDELGQIAISDASSWSDVTGTVRRSFDSALLRSKGVPELFQKLTANIDALEERISNIHKFVARDVRYVSMSQNGHSTVPHAVEETLENRLGDCKDKSALLVALLDAAGVEARPVLVATDRSDPERLNVPALSYFDHMVVCFDGTTTRHCLDATDSDTDWRSTPAWIQGKVALSLSSGGKPTTIETRKHRWRLEVESTLEFTRDGGQRETTKRVYYSEYAGAMRSRLSGKSVESRNRWLLDEYQEEVSDSVEPTFEVVGIEDIDEELQITSTAVYKAIASVDEDLQYYENDPWLRDLMDAVALKNRIYDSFFPGIQVVSKYRLDISSRWRVDGTNAHLKLQHEFGSMTRAIRREGHGIVLVSTTLDIPSRRIAAARAEEFNEFLRLLKREAMVRIFGKPL